MTLRLIDACQQNLSIRPCLCYDQTFDPSFRMNAHNHTTVELMYAVNGSFKHTFYKDKKPQQTLEVSKGQILLINSAVHHKLVVLEKTHIQCIAFDFTTDRPDAFPLSVLCQNTSAFNSFAQEDVDWVIINSCPSWSEIFNSLFELLTMQKKDLEQVVDYRLLLNLNTGVFWTKLTLSHFMIKSHRRAYTYVNEAKSYIDAHLENPITADSIASEVGLTPNYLQTLFKSVTNSTIIEYINKQRIMQADFLLRNSDKNIEEIGFDVGFNTREHFTRTFHSIVGLSPSEYRNNLFIVNYTENDLYMIERLPTDEFNIE